MTGEEMFLSFVVGTMLVFMAVLGGTALFTRGSSSASKSGRDR